MSLKLLTTLPRVVAEAQAQHGATQAQGAQTQGQQENWINPSVCMCSRYGLVIRSLSPNDTKLLKGYFCDEVCPIPPPIACIQSQPPPARPEPITSSSQPALHFAPTSLAPAPTSQPTAWPQLSDNEWPTLPSAPTSWPQLSYKDAVLFETPSHIRELTLEELLELDLTTSDAEGIYDRSCIRELSLKELLALDAESDEGDGEPSQMLKLIHCGNHLLRGASYSNFGPDMV